MKLLNPDIKLKNIIKTCHIMEKSGIKLNNKYFAVSNPYIKISGKSVIISGQTTQPVITSLDSGTNGFAFSLRLGSAYRLFGIPSNLYTDQVLNLDDLPGSSIKDLIKKLRSAEFMQEKINLVENFMINKNYDPTGFNLNLFEALIRTTSNTIPSIAGELGFSTRQLQRIINTYIGMSPVLLKRVIRFEKALYQMQAFPKTSLVMTAYECGYTDQSHFIRDFKEFSGLTPSEYLLTMSDFYNTNNAL